MEVVADNDHVCEAGQFGGRGVVAYCARFFENNSLLLFAGGMGSMRFAAIYYTYADEVEFEVCA